MLYMKRVLIWKYCFFYCITLQEILYKTGLYANKISCEIYISLRFEPHTIRTSYKMWMLNALTKRIIQELDGWVLEKSPRECGAYKNKY
jgi:hypothetical protein